MRKRIFNKRQAAIKQVALPVPPTPKASMTHEERRDYYKELQAFIPQVRQYVGSQQRTGYDGSSNNNINRFMTDLSTLFEELALAEDRAIVEAHTQEQEQREREEREVLRKQGVTVSKDDTADRDSHVEQALSFFLSEDED